MGRRHGITRQTLKVLSVLMEDLEEQHYGFELMKRTGLPTGTVYPILTRLEGDGWVTSAWEDIDPSVEGRRPRRYYHITALGIREAERHRKEILEQLSWRPAWN